MYQRSRRNFCAKSVTHADVCGFVKLKEEHADWTDAQLDAEYDKTDRFKGEYMSLSDSALKKVSGVITKKINKGNIGQFAAMKNSNSPESFLSGSVVHSDGKGLNLSQADGWKISLDGVVCERSLKRKYPEAIGELLGVTGENDIRRNMRDEFYRGKDKDKI